MGRQTLDIDILNKAATWWAERLQNVDEDSRLRFRAALLAFLQVDCPEVIWTTSGGWCATLREAWQQSDPTELPARIGNGIMVIPEWCETVAVNSGWSEL